MHKSKRSPHFMYTMFTEPLEVSTQHPYLGILLSQDLKWTPHINSITAKANSTLGFLRRNIRGASREVRAKAYTSLVRPKLEYASEVWDPQRRQYASSNTLENKLESVQRRAIRYVFNDYRSSTSVTQLQNQLGWQTLQQRRMQSRLVLLYKATHNLVALPLHHYITKHTIPTRGHPLRYNTLTCRTNTFSSSFFPRTIKEWNTLPNHIVSQQTVNGFKSELARHMGHSDPQI